MCLIFTLIEFLLIRFKCQALFPALLQLQLFLFDTPLPKFLGHLKSHPNKMKKCFADSQCAVDKCPQKSNIKKYHLNCSLINIHHEVLIFIVDFQLP